jgi:hypothetical protein
LLKIEELDELPELPLEDCVEDISPGKEATDEVNDTVDRLDRDTENAFIDDGTAEDRVLLNNHEDKAKSEDIEKDRTGMSVPWKSRK